MVVVNRVRICTLSMLGSSKVCIPKVCILLLLVCLFVEYGCGCLEDFLEIG